MNLQSEPEYSGLVLSQEEVRAIDAAAISQLEMPGLLLMENAARGVVDQLRDCCATGTVTIISGPGNNGGDGLAVARLLSAEGRASRILLETGGKPLTPDAQSNLTFLRNSGVDVRLSEGVEDISTLSGQLNPDDWIVDSLLGTGVRGGLRPPFADWVRAINASPARVLAVDVPSGLDCDTGTCSEDCVQADITVTFVGMKRGFLTPSAVKYTGQVVVSHIGIPEQWVREWVEHQRRG